MDATEWLGLRATHNPTRYWLPVTPPISAGSAFLFGGCGLGAAVAALETTTGRPLVWATAQYLSYAPVGAVMDLDVHVAVAGRRTTQARAVGHVGDEEILTVNAALGRRDFDLVEQWPTPPPVREPDRCPEREQAHGIESVGTRLEQRWALAPDGGEGPTGHGRGRVCVWAREPDGLDASAAALAILGDWVPMGLGTAAGGGISSNSLDNTLRVLEVRPTDWFLLEIEPAGIRHGFGHGQLRIWHPDGSLMAIASQSVIVRRRRPDGASRPPRRLVDKLRADRT
ncbi:MAG: acyl-CoA thioesterase [Actinomyces sp.]|nr:MAG: acyl-CoA thioesterase [Actinomyces sp.]